MKSRSGAGRGVRVLGLSIALLSLIGSETRAEIYGFEAISNSSGVSGTVAEQLRVEVTPYKGDSGRVFFTFANDISAPHSGNIMRVFFDDRGGLGSISELVKAPGFTVDFQLGAKSKGNLPGGNNLTPGFMTTDWISFHGGKNKIGPGEYLGVVYDLKGEATFQDLIDAIQDGVSGKLRIGMHVGGIGRDYRDSFLMTHVPVPGAVLLGAWGISTAGLFLRRRRDLTSA